MREPADAIVRLLEVGAFGVEKIEVGLGKATSGLAGLPHKGGQTGTNLRARHAGDSEFAVGLYARSCGIRPAVLNTTQSETKTRKG